MWNQKNSQQDTRLQTKKEVDKQVQEQSTQEQNQKQEVNKEQKENQEQVINHLSPKEIEKLKKEKDLVWYEIPELGIKFLVTKDTKNDLKYSYKEFRGYRHNNNYLKVKSVMLYSSSETDKNLSNCTFSEDTGWSCGWIDISLVQKKELYDFFKHNKKLKNSWCDNFRGSFYVNEYIGCVNLSREEVKYYLDNEEYKNFFHIPSGKSNKVFGIYLNTIQSIK